MNWQQVLDDKSLQDLPYKIELNREGQIVMSPAKNNHSDLQIEIAYLLRTLLPKGRALVECAIQTTDDVKVADVVWLTAARRKLVRHEAVYSIAPEICVEVESESNTAAELAHKKDLYFVKGAIEVWLCALDGTMSFYQKHGKIERSELAPRFPRKIRI